jgi:hypothetical protein
VDSVGLRVRGLPLVDQVLVLARLAEARSEASSMEMSTATIAVTSLLLRM